MENGVPQQNEVSQQTTEQAQIAFLASKAVHGTLVNPLPEGGYEVIGKQCRKVIHNGYARLETPSGLVTRPTDRI